MTLTASTAKDKGCTTAQPLPHSDTMRPHSKGGEGFVHDAPTTNGTHQLAACTLKRRRRDIHACRKNAKLLLRYTPNAHSHNSREIATQLQFASHNSLSQQGSMQVPARGHARQAMPTATSERLKTVPHWSFICKDVRPPGTPNGTHSTAQQACGGNTRQHACMHVSMYVCKCTMSHM